MTDEMNMNEQTENWYADDVATLGDRIAAAREAANMSQKKLAKRIGVKLNTLVDWEEDLSEPRANRLSMLAGLLNVSVMWLLSGVGDGVDPPQDENAISSDVNDILLEIRDLKSHLSESAERLGRLEKKLRKTLQSE